MKVIDRFLTSYLAWLCRILAVGPAQINKVQTRNGGAFAPRPEGAMGFYF